MALTPIYRPRDAQPQDGARFDATNPLAASFHTVYAPALGLENLSAGGAGEGLQPHAAPAVQLPTAGRAASIVATNQRLVSSPSFGPTPAYPITMVWVGRQGSTANTQIAGITSASGIGGSYYYIGGGSSTLIALSARNNYGSALGMLVAVPGGSAIGVELVVVVQSLSANNHRASINGSAVATDTTNIGAMVAWDRVFMGQSASANNQATALLAVASGGVPLTDEQMQQLSRDAREVYALFEPQRILVPVASAAGADFTFSGSGGIQFSGAATAQSTAAFSVSGSGGLQFAGAATNTFTNAFSVSGSGGLSFGGTASGVYTTAWAASGSGGLQFGGAAGATSGSDYAVTGAGGITFAGAAAALNSADFSMSATGGLLFAGAAAAQVDAGFAATGSGGLLLGGAAGAVTSPTFAFSGGGGLLLGGDAAQACTTVYGFTASGGMLLAGAATASMSTGGSTGATVDDIWNGILLEASLSPADMLRIILAAVSGKTTGIGTDTEHYLSVDGSKARVAATFDGNGNRQAVTLDGSA